MDAVAAYRFDQAGGVATLCLDRPDRGNAIPPEAIGGLTDLFRSLADDRTVRAVLVRGEGRNFSAGGDVAGFARSLEQPADVRRADFRARLDRAKSMVEAYLAIPVPVVAACQGAVAGAGMLFALGADYVIADETVAFVFAQLRIGLPPDGGVSLLLPRVVGQRRAAELILTAARVEAQEAWRIGLASRLVAPNALADEAREQAARFARAPSAAARAAKRLLADAPGRTPAEQLAAERDAITEAVVSPDFEEGVRAFLEKRPAAFPSAR